MHDFDIPGMKASDQDMVVNAIQAGGSAPNAIQDHGWMYSHGFQDLDGHMWEVMYMDESQMPQ